MNRVVRWVIRALFAPVTGHAGAVASTLGFLAFLPLHSLQIPLLFAFSLLLHLNIIALFLGMLITTFIPSIRDLPVLDLRFLEDFGLFPELLTNVQLSPSIVVGIFWRINWPCMLCFFPLVLQFRTEKKGTTSRTCFS